MLQITITSSTWRDNTAGSGAGLAFSAESLSSPAMLNISESIFNNNTAIFFGGGITLQGHVEVRAPLAPTAGWYCLFTTSQTVAAVC